jgi:hypothetical protein
MVTLTSTTLSDNIAQGGMGGPGGDPGGGAPDGAGGSGGNGGLSQGGGILIADGTLNLDSSTLVQNAAPNSQGGPAGLPGSGTPSNGFGVLGQGGDILRLGGTVNNQGTALSIPQTVGAFDQATGTWYLRNENDPGAPDAGQFAYGGPGWDPVVGDWNGDGQTSVGSFNPGTATWYLRNENSAGPADAGTFAYGAPGWKPISGDWRGAGPSTIGAFDPATATWYLRNENSAGPADAGTFQYGAPGWDPVVGDWQGNGVTTIGAVDPKTMTWYLRSSNSSGAPTITLFQFGAPGWIPVVGDWNGDGITSIGAIDPATGTWYLRNENSAGSPDAGVFRYGAPGWEGVAGSWRGLAAPERAAGATPLSADNSDPGTGELTNQELQQTVSAALTRLQDAGVAPTVIQHLRSDTFEVGNLSGATLGYTYASAHTVVIDASADGFGWFLDATPLQNEEFTPDGQGQLTALAGGPAAGKMDLLTVVLHEMGHLVGRKDLDPSTNPDSLMTETLGLGQRRTEALDSVFSQLGHVS